MNVSMLTKKRLIILLSSLILMTTVLLIRLGYIQMIKGKVYKKLALDQWTLDIMVAPRRGTIYDRNRNVLAISSTAGKISAIPKNIKDPQNTAKLLSDLLGLKYDDVYKKITQNVQEVLLKRRVPESTVKKLLSLDLSGVEISNDTTRVYPNNNLLSHVLGFTGVDNQGLDGIELVYDKYLKGSPGYISSPIDALGRKLNEGAQEYHYPVDGDNLVLTIDENIQKFTEKALDDAYHVNNPSKGISAIVMNPKTGEILAMANRPDYNPNDPFSGDSQDWFKNWRNKAISDANEPGSIFKIITSAAALDLGVVTPNTPFYDKGFVMVAGQKIKCWAWYDPHGAETFTQGVQNSCNIVFVETAQKMGVEPFYNYIKNFGFGEPTGVTLPGEANGIVTDESKVGPVELATISFGQGISVTAMQMINAVCAIANGGNLMQPTLVKSIIGPDNKVIENFKPKVIRRVIKPETTKLMREIFENAVTNGTGKRAYIPGYRVAGKTGTSEKYTPGKYVASFVCFAPANDPVLACVVMVDEPNGVSHMGGAVAAPIAKSIMEDSLKYLGVKPQYTEKEKHEIQKGNVQTPDLTGLDPNEAKAILIKQNLNYEMEGTGNTVLDQSPKPYMEIQEGSTVYLYTTPNSMPDLIEVPDLIGKTAAEAEKEISNIGLKLRIKGDGTVINQSPASGKSVPKGSIIDVNLSPPQQKEGP